MQATRLRRRVSGAIDGGCCLANEVQGKKRQAPDVLVIFMEYLLQFRKYCAYRNVRYFPDFIAFLISTLPT